MLQREIDDIEEEKYRGAAVRCKIDREQEDIPTKHFQTLSNEKAEEQEHKGD